MWNHQRYVLAPAILIALTVLFLRPVVARAANADRFFLENKGQIVDQSHTPNTRVLFLLNREGANVQLRNDGFAYDLHVTQASMNGPHVGSKDGPDERMQHRFHRIDLQWRNGAPAQWTTHDRGVDHTNYYGVPGSPDGVLDVHHYRSVIAQEVWPFIDVEFLVDEDGFKYNVLVRPGGRIEDVRFDITGASASLSPDGSLTYSWGIDDRLEERIPLSYLNGRAGRRKVTVGFDLLDANTLGFRMEDDRLSLGATLCIDPYPSLDWCTYYGGGLHDYTAEPTMDANGNIYLSGYTRSADNIATSGAHDATINANLDAFLAKLDANGVRSWGTYYGGLSGTTGTTATASSANAMGQVCMVGFTDATTGIATAFTHKTAKDANSIDAFLVLFNTNGQRIWGTYLGGEGDDRISDISLDDTGSPVVIGETMSTAGIATVGSFDGSYAGGRDAFVARFTATGTRIWGTYIGGSSGESGGGICYVGSSSIAVCGTTGSSSGIASSGSFDAVLSGPEDGFLLYLNMNGQRTWGTYYGGSGSDQAADVAWVSVGKLALVGNTSSTSGMSTPGAAQGAHGGGAQDGFLAVFTTTSGQRVWGTYCGGESGDAFSAVTGNGSGEIYACGGTSSTTGIATPGAIMTSFHGGSGDGLIAGYDVVGTRRWTTYYGSNSDEGLSAICASSIIVCAGGGTRSSVGVSTPGAFQTNYGGGFIDGFVLRLADIPPLQAPEIPAPAEAASGSRCTVLVFDGMLRLELIEPPLCAEGVAQVTLIDPAGRVMKTFSAPTNTLSTGIPLVRMPPGVYCAVVETPCGTVSRRFIHPG